MAEPVHILSTRPFDPSLAEQAARQHIVLEALSFIETRILIDEITGGKIAALSLTRIVAIFTSMNAVDAVAQYLRGAVIWKIFCIGSATRQRVQEYFGERSIAGTADSAGALARVIIGHCESKEVVFFCGDQRRDELPEQLKNEGIQINELVVYKTPC